MESVESQGTKWHSLYSMLLDEKEIDNKQNEKNIQAEMEYSQRANEWKAVIKQAPSGLEEIRPRWPCFYSQHSMLLARNSQQPIMRTVIIYF